MDLVLGIDPGKTGALVLVDIVSKDIIDGLIMPTYLQGTKVRLNEPAIVNWLLQYQGRIKICFLEQVSAHPQDGKASAFAFGKSTGIVRGIALGLQIPVKEITSPVWKRHFNFTNKGKDAPRGEASALFPKLEIFTLKGKGQAAADAYYIARCGIEKHL